MSPKTAYCHLIFNISLANMQIATHVWRTIKRLGLIGPKVNADQAHTVIAKITPPEWVYPLHVNLITHGRRACHAQRPACSECPLYSECAYIGRVNLQETTTTPRG